MRLSVSLFVITLVGLGITACGDAGKSPRPASGNSSRTVAGDGDSRNTSKIVKLGRDNDNDDSYTADDDPNNNSVSYYGHAAGSADRQAVTALIRRYYMVAVAEDGASGCSMLVSSLARAVPEDYGHAPGPSYLRGATTCSAVMSKFFNHSHARLAAEVPALQVVAVRLSGRTGWVLLSFGAMPERRILVEHEGRAWKIGELLDVELP